jgi:quercetin dioxygenase-like cupin family protein
MAKKKHFPRTPGAGIDVTPEEMAGRIARYKDLRPDPDAFPDSSDPSRKRSVAFAISPGNSAGPAAISAPHGFHIVMIESGKSKRPPSHAHPYNEVFVCLEGRFAIYWGIDAEAKAERGEPDAVLDPFDMVSVPPGTMRNFDCVSEQPGKLMVIFDTFGDPNIGVVVPPDLYEQYYRNA